MAFVTPLFLAFDEADLPIPQGKGVYINAELPIGVDHAQWRPVLTCFQSWRDRYLRLSGAGYSAYKEADDGADSYDFALVLVGKHRAETLANIAMANRLVRPGGPVIIGGPKRAGAASLKKLLAQKTPLHAGFSKHHWQVFVGDAGQIEFEQPSPEKGPNGFVTAPGMFSHKMIDAGSALLVAHLPRDPCGSLADFGCGWGYLAVEALKKAGASHVTLIDAHAPSLNAAQANLAAQHPGVPCHTHWLDIASEEVPKRYDTIIMNPPFHTSDQTDVNLGIAFIEKAAGALKPGGRLIMVANRQLPYENMLDRQYRHWQEIASDNRFKALIAVR